MYGRKLGDTVLAFGHEGVLYRRSFVMYDRGTRSLWVHTTGECVKGAMKGKQLSFIPSAIMSWGAWKKQHPETLVLEGRRAQGFMGTYALTKERAHHFGLSVGQGDSAKLYPVTKLLASPVVQDTFGDAKIVIFFDAEGLHATAWLRGEREFRLEGGKILDAKSRAWDPMLGQPAGVESSKEMMTPLPATMWLADRWKGFYPEGEVFEAK